MWFSHRLIPGEQHDDSREDERGTVLYTGGAIAREPEELLRGYPCPWAEVLLLYT